MRLLPFGDRALLAEFDAQDDVLGALAAWHDSPAGVLELTPAARTVLVRIDPAVIGLGHLEHWLLTTPRSTASREPGTLITVPVVYDGEDIAVVADGWGCSTEAAITRHLELEWVCAFIGFSPGFPYLVPVNGASALPAVPRRSTSRTEVPAGSVALAAEYCGMYPRTSPGGWQLLGHTDAVLWDTSRDEPALVTPGTRVRFVRVPA